MTKAEQLKELFEKWQEDQKSEEFESEAEYFKYHKKHPGDAGYIPKGYFICDGIIFEDAFETANPTILFLGKECNSHKRNDKSIESKTDNSSWMKEQTDVRFIKGLALLSNAIIDDNYTVPNKDLKSLRNVALINLNKRGGYDTCLWRTLKGYVAKYCQVIKEEIEIINPDYIICCGEDVKLLVDKYHLADGRNIKLTYHPSCYCKSDIDKLDYLKTGVKPKKVKK